MLTLLEAKPRKEDRAPLKRRIALPQLRMLEPKWLGKKTYILTLATHKKAGLQPGASPTCETAAQKCRLSLIDIHPDQDGGTSIFSPWAASDKSHIFASRGQANHGARMSHYKVRAVSYSAAWLVE